jgi:hypothetical protein
LPPVEPVLLALLLLKAWTRFACGIKPAHLAKESGYSRAHLFRIRMGTTETTGRGLARIAAACRRLSHESVRTEDLFELENDE